MPTTPPRPTTRPTVVLVDPSLRILEPLRHALSDTLPGVRLIATTSIPDALEACRTQHPDVLVTGADPDRLGGRLFLERARSMARDSQVIVMRQGGATRDELDAWGALAIVGRPPSAELLANLVGGLTLGHTGPRLNDPAAEGIA